MRIKLKIRQKITILVLTATTILYMFSVGYIVTKSRQAMLDDAFEKARLIARMSADKVEKEFERDLAVTRTLAQAFSVYQDLPTSTWQDLYKKMYKPVLEGNKHVYSVWDSWELYGFVPNYAKDYGRFSITLWHENGGIQSVSEMRSIDGDPDKYKAFKDGNVDDYWDPYLDEGNLLEKGEALMMTTIASPIQLGGRFMGLIGLDISLESLQKSIASIEPVEGSYAFLISSNYMVAAHHNPKFINIPIDSLLPFDCERENLHEVITRGLAHCYIHLDEQGEEHYIAFAPIQAGNSPSTWSLALSMPLKTITQRADKNFNYTIMVGIIVLIVLTIILLSVSNSVIRPIRLITHTLDRLSKGEISDDLYLQLNTGDEIEAMANSLNISLEALNKKNSFANSIGEGKLDSQLELLSNEDLLGKSLMAMRNSLSKAQQEQQVHINEEQKRTWANEGFALFADILRRNNENLDILTDEVLSRLVKYVEGNQGALFLLNEDGEPYLEAASVYAWERKKYMDIKVLMGEGLVGACAVERETIYLTEIPENFVSITSGLGEANPNCIVLVPIKQDENLIGVLEIASFKVFERFEVEFLEKVSESIAATIGTVRINTKTLMLLEQSQQQAEEMLTQEEEMRQNMEELMATQEEMSRKEREMEWTMNAIGGLGLLMEYDFKGTIISVNALYAKRAGYQKEELIGQHHSILFANPEAVKTEKYQKFWQDMNNGIPFTSILKRRDKSDRAFTIKTHCHPVFDEDGNPFKVVEIGFDISEYFGKG